MKNLLAAIVLLAFAAGFFSCKDTSLSTEEKCRVIREIRKGWFGPSTKIQIPNWIFGLKGDGEKTAQTGRGALECAKKMVEDGRTLCGQGDVEFDLAWDALNRKARELGCDLGRKEKYSQKEHISSSVAKQGGEPQYYFDHPCNAGGPLGCNAPGLVPDASECYGKKNGTPCNLHGGKQGGKCLSQKLCVGTCPDYTYHGCWDRKGGRFSLPVFSAPPYSP